MDPQSLCNINYYCALIRNNTHVQSVQQLILSIQCHIIIKSVHYTHPPFEVCPKLRNATNLEGVSCVVGSIIVEYYHLQKLEKQNNGQCQGNSTAAVLLTLKGPDFDLIVFCAGHG